MTKKKPSYLGDLENIYLINCQTVEGDTFLLYCPHQDDYDQLIEAFLADLFVEEATSSKVTLRFGVFANAQREPDVEERFFRARIAANSVEDDPKTLYGFYEFA